MRPVVLLHPLGSDRSFWDAVPLPEDRRWFALDLPGHGAAPVPEVADGIAGLGRYVLDAANEAGIAEFDVIGVSLGGLVAQHLAVQAPDRVSGTVLVDTVVRYPAPMVAMWRGRAELARTLGLADLVAPTLDIWFTAAFRATHPDVVERTTQTLLATRAEGYARTCELLADADLSSALGQLPVRTLAVCGEQDGDPFREAARAISEATGRPVCWLDGKHAAVLEQPAAFARQVVSFLSADLPLSMPQKEEA